MRIAVVGHLEWVDFFAVERVPTAGEIVQGAPLLAVAAGGGAVAAAQLARWGADALFFTALGDDDLGHRAHAELTARSVKMRSVFRAGEPQRRAVTFVDAQRERTIVVIGDRHVPRASDPLSWDELATCDAVYITGGDVGAVRAARAARTVVATSRILPLLREAAIDVDALVGSANDPNEVYAKGDLVPAPHLVVRTDGERGGTFELGGVTHAYAATPAVVTGDTYGAGDTFAAALALALAEAGELQDDRDAADAIAFAAARAAEVLAWRGPFPPS
jgi:ribokinase